METIAYKGKEYPVASVNLADIDSHYDEITYVADYALWEAIEDNWCNGEDEATDIDNKVLFYFEDGYLSTNPTYDEIISKLREEML